MPVSCIHCGAATVVDDAGVVCTNCAELAEPSLVVLTSHTDQPSTTYDGWIPVAPKTLKTGRNRYLEGHGKQVRDSKNLDEMHWFIKNLARAAFVSGTTDRAYNLFEQAMAAGQYRWGRAAKLVAGACISIALRQSNRPDMFPDLALLLGQKVIALTRAFSSVISVLDIRDLPSSEPKSHVSTLQAHLFAAIQGSVDSELPPALIAAVKPLHAPAILATATSLSDLLASSVPPSALARLPATATACGVLIWAIEAEARTSLAQLGDLAAFLGSKCNVKKPLVMGRYKVIQDEIMDRIDKIEWLDHYQPNNGKNGRAKIPRRLVVARGLKAVIESEREYRREQLNHTGRTKGDESDSDELPDRGPRKRRRVHALQEATRFLLNPLSGPLPASFLSASHSSLPLPTFLLTSSLSMRRNTVPSRLQLLSAARGGVGPDEIRDDELFEDGELDKIMRTDDQIIELRGILGWEEGAEEEKPPTVSSKPRKRTAKPTKPTASTRLNSEAVASFFTDEKEDYEDYEFEGLLQLDDGSGSLVIEDGNDTDAFVGLDRTLVDSFAAEEEDDEDLFSFRPSPEPDDRYAQEV
ncbi:hypothetical protein C8R47DRAFT_1318207 [Mycena vitilis]|nr:hypothetical protein C8R47DRAFT_1318207 [Mycena vitilis]